MKAFLINPVDRAIEQIEVNNQAEIIKLIGFDTVIADDIGDNGDKLYFDEECFLRGTEGRFQVDSLVPVSGVGVVIGSGSADALADVQTDLEAVRARTKFI